jgi:hypothetical protein
MITIIEGGAVIAALMLLILLPGFLGWWWQRLRGPKASPAATPAPVTPPTPALPFPFTTDGIASMVQYVQQQRHANAQWGDTSSQVARRMDEELLQSWTWAQYWLERLGSALDVSTAEFRTLSHADRASLLRRAAERLSGHLLMLSEEHRSYLLNRLSHDNASLGDAVSAWLPQSRSTREGNLRDYARRYAERMAAGLMVPGEAYDPAAAGGSYSALGGSYQSFLYRPLPAAAPAHRPMPAAATAPAAPAQKPPATPRPAGPRRRDIIRLQKRRTDEGT